MLLETIENVYNKNPKEINRFIKFSIVGAVGAVIDFTLLNLIFHIIHYTLEWNLLAQYNIDGDLLFANSISTSVTIVSNFVWNRLWTFPESRTRKKRTQLVQFVIVNIIGLIITGFLIIAIDSVLVSYMSKFLSINLAKAISIGIVLFWNFGANRLWTYRGL